VSSAERGQRLIGDIHASAGQFFMHPHEVLFAVVVQRDNLIVVRLGDLGSDQRRDLIGPAGKHFTHSLARNPKRSGDRTYSLTTFMQL
jgi:hypothetical protein